MAASDSREGVETEDEHDIRVLHLDDDGSFLEMAAELIERAGESIEVVITTDAVKALEHLAAQEFECVVSDYQMPEMDGLEFLRKVREHYPNLPFLLFTGKGSEELAGEAISAGVTDYLQKETGVEQFTVLANRIENTVAKYRAEQRAAETNRRIRRVYERVTDAVVAFDDGWRYTYLNGRAADLLQSDEDELLGETVWEVFPTLEDSEIGAALRESMRTQQTRTVQAYFEPLGNWFEVHVYPDKDGVSAYFQDVSDRKERDRRYEAIFNQTFQFTGLMEPDGTLIEANRTALEFGGIEREEVVGKKIWKTDWFQESVETREYARRAIERAAKGEFVRDELPVQGADGTVVIDFSVRPVTDESGDVVLLIPEGRDITERTEREAELREERAFTRSVFEALPDVFYAFDPDGTFLRWNDRLSEVTGYDDEEISEMHPTDFFEGEAVGVVADAIQTVFEQERTVTVEAPFATKDGERIPYEFTGAPLRMESNGVQGLVGMGRDVSDRKKRERELEQKNERLEEFASVVSHDLRNPLMVAEGNVSLARETGDLSYLEDAEGAIERMEQLIDDLLHLAEQGQVVHDLEPVSICDTLQTVGQNLGQVDRSVTVECGTDEKVLADRGRFVELLENLVGNALEHGGEGITVRLGATDGTIYVADDGLGIPADEREEVFTAGYTTSEDGTGFGLSIVQSVADAHGWTVDIVESEDGGARFEITGFQST